MFEMKSVATFRFGTPIVPWAKTVCPEWTERNEQQLVMAAMAVANGCDPATMLEHISVNGSFVGGFVSKFDKLNDEGPPISEQEFWDRMERIPQLEGNPVGVRFPEPNDLTWNFRNAEWHGGHILALYLSREGKVQKEFVEGSWKNVQPLSGWGVYWWGNGRGETRYRWVKMAGNANEEHVFDTDSPVSIARNWQGFCTNDRVDAIIGANKVVRL